MTTAFVSVIVPCRDEVRFIERCLASISATTHPRDRLEIIVVDGMSDDGTREVLSRAAARDDRLTVLDNPALIAPAAMNLGIARAVGGVIMRMDAHCEYPPEYIPTLVAALDQSGAANVGGVTQVLPAADTPVARAIALALSHRAGVGNSYFRIGLPSRRWVDTVPFGCWKRETLERGGLFDESLPRNQDDEFNMRLRRAGGRILLLPDVVTRYYARATLRQLGRMFFQYGYYKPLAALRALTPLRPRQFAPAALVVALILGVLQALFMRTGARLLEVTVGAYAAFVVAAALPIALRRGLAIALAFTAALPTMHVAYGLGFLRGVWHFAILKRAPDAITPQLSR